MQETLSHYRILEQIGAGGMGVVFRARDEHLDRDVALKVLSSSREVDANAHKRFHKEALTLSRLNHPNIATLHDFGREDGSDFLVEEFIEGRSLDVILVCGPVSEKQLIDIGLQLAEGLDAAHKHGIIHCDLKPSNIRITPDSRAKILDFGLARMFRRHTTATADTETLTEVESSGGTLPYMAPEQLLGDALDPRTDIWGLGCVLYEMATGKRPFSGSGTALMDAILHRFPPPVTKGNPRISLSLEAIIGKCIDKDPGKRYQSAKEVIVDLKRAASAPVAMGVRVRVQRHVRTLAFVLLAAAAVTLAIRIWPGLRRTWFEARAREPAATRSAVPHEMYLAGMKQLERWDKPESLESAINSFDEAARLDPGFALAFSALGEAYWAKYRLDRNPKWIDEAEKNCRRAAELTNTIPAVYVVLARVHNSQGHYDLALQEVQHAQELEPHNGDALLVQAAIYGSMGREKQAGETYGKATALRPEHWGGYYEFGAYLFRTQRYEEAATQFRRVLELTPDNALAHATLGGVLQLLSKPAEAESHLKTSINLQPSYVAYSNLGVLYYNQRRWAEAAEMIKKGLDLNPSDWRTWHNLELAYEWLGKKDDADHAFDGERIRLEEAAKLTPDDPEIEVRLGVHYARAKLKDKTVSYVEAALARSPDDASVLVNAGEAYEKLGDRTRAIELVSRAVARGWTLAQLEDDPGLQGIVHDPRFVAIASQSTNGRSPAR